MPTNNHTIARSKYIQRGSIITSDGVTLADLAAVPEINFDIKL